MGKYKSFRKIGFFQDLGLGKEFSDLTAKAQLIKEQKLINWTLLD